MSRPESSQHDGQTSELLAHHLLKACKDEDTPRARDLVEKGVPPGYVDPESGWSCLHWAVYNGNSTISRALIHAGACDGYKRASALAQARRANVHNDRRASLSDAAVTDTPLHWAAFRGDLRITWILLTEGYSPNDEDGTENTPVHLAAANGHERVLDTLIRDGADVHRRNKFMNTPRDLANSSECRDLLQRAEALRAPSAEEAERMHAENLQRILWAEEILIDAIGPDGTSHPDEQGKETRGNDGEDRGSLTRSPSATEAGDATEGVDPSHGGTDGAATGAVEEAGSEGGDDSGSRSLSLAGPGETRERDPQGEKHGEDGDDGRGEGLESKERNDGERATSTVEAPETEASLDRGEGAAAGHGVVTTMGEADPSTLDDDDSQQILSQVERIREAVAGAESLCVCEELVATAKLKIDSLLLQQSIQEQAARVAAAGPILTQEAYTTLVNRLMLLLRRSEGNPRIKDSLRKRAKALIEKSHAEYWLQVSTHRLGSVECAQPRHMGDMAKVKTCIEQASATDADSILVTRCRSLLQRLTTEVEIGKAIEAFPNVRLPMEVMPKDYWQPEDLGHIEETDGFPLPPADEEGKALDYIWIPSDSLRALSRACKRMVDALSGAEGLNQALVERGAKRLHEAQKELKVLEEKDAVDKEKAIAVAAKAAKKLKKKGGKGKKGKKK